MSNANLQADFRRHAHHVEDARELLVPIRARVCIAPGVDLDGLRPHAMRRLDLFEVGVHEKTGRDTVLAQTPHDLAHGSALGAHVESALRRELLPSLGHQGDRVRAYLERNLQHFRGCGHFEAEALVNSLSQESHVRVLDVPTVLAQVDHDSVRPSQQRQGGRRNRIGLQPSPRLPHGGHVVDVHHEPTAAHRSSSPIAFRICAHTSSASSPIRRRSFPSTITRATGSVPE